MIVEASELEASLFEPESPQQSLLASSRDYVYNVKVNGASSGATCHGKGCEAITGYTPREFTEDSSLWYQMIHPEDREAVVAHFDRIVHGEEPRPLEHRIFHKNGEVRWIRNVPIPQHDAEGRVIAYTGLISDITESRQAIQLLRLQCAVTRQLVEGGTIPQTLRRMLRVVCETCPWDWAAFWNYEETSNLLQWSGIWCAPANGLHAFAEASRRLQYAPTCGSVNQAWMTEQPVWITDLARDQQFPRAAAAALAGLHSACLVPIRRDGDMAGIIELFTHAIRRPDAHLMQMVSAVGVQIGLFLDRKSAEETLTKERNLLRTLIDALPDFIYAKDLESRFIMNNQAHAQVLGARQPIDVVGKSDLEYFSPDLARRYRADELEILRTGRPLFNREEPVVDAQGNHHIVLTTKVPWKDPQGRMVGLIGVTHDITDLKKSEENQRLIESRLQAIMDNSPAVIYLKDIQGRYQLVNRRFESLFNVLREAVAGKTNHDLFPPDVAGIMQANDDQVLADGLAREFEEAVPHNDGLHTYISIKFPLLDSAGVPYALCGISTDITERKRAEEQLQHAYADLAENQAALKQTFAELEVAHEELKTTGLQLIQAAKLECIGTLAAGVAHEVKNPLQTILMGLHYLANRLPADQPGLQCAMKEMRDAVNRANGILRELLELSADTKSELKPDDLNACVEHALDLMRYEFVAAQTVVVKNLADALPPVLMNSGKIGQVLINVFMNALHAMGSGGTLTVITRAVVCDEVLMENEAMYRGFTPGEVLAVTEAQDTGPGVPEHLLPKIFDPFVTTKPLGQGTGMGLAVAKRIVDLHGGAVAIANNDGGGARITLVLKTQTSATL